MLTIPIPTIASGGGNHESIELSDISSEEVERKDVGVLPNTEDTGNVYHDGAPPIIRFLVLTSIISALLFGALDPLSTVRMFHSISFCSCSIYRLSPSSPKLCT